MTKDARVRKVGVKTERTQALGKINKRVYLYIAYYETSNLLDKRKDRKAWTVKTIQLAVPMKLCQHKQGTVVFLLLIFSLLMLLIVTD